MDPKVGLDEVVLSKNGELMVIDVDEKGGFHGDLLGSNRYSYNSHEIFMGVHWI